MGIFQWAFTGGDPAELGADGGKHVKGSGKHGAPKSWGGSKPPKGKDLAPGKGGGKHVKGGGDKGGKGGKAGADFEDIKPWWK
jgi:hypothetical protein